MCAAESKHTMKGILETSSQNLKFKKTDQYLKILRQPGIEPGSIAWKATMLTFTPPTLKKVGEK